MEKAAIEFKLQIAIHIYCKKETDKLKGVIGNTYKSIGITLVESPKYTFKVAEKSPLTVYFHTNTNPSDQMFAIFDFFIHGN